MAKSKNKIVENAAAGASEINNSLGDLASSLIPFPGQGGPMVSQANTLFFNNRWYLISNYRQLLSELYVEHGIVQTLVDQPVDDAFRAGFEIKTSELDGNDIEKLQIYIERHRVIHNVMQAAKWARLFGGGAILIITDQDPKTPLNIDKITEKSPLEFRAVDMWELYCNEQNVQGDTSVGGALGANKGEFYDYYGFPIHQSRVYIIPGKEAPSFIRPRLRGWGMSELERLVRSINQYMKNQDVAFELLDEAKIDVYKIKGFNSALLNAVGTGQVSKRIQEGNIIKNYNHAIVMDASDEYEQKIINFTGLADMLPQIRLGIAADLKMPVTKLFGMSAAGFNSGEDDIENYNSMIEGEIRSKVKFAVLDVLNICCQKLFGFAPDDLMIEFNSLRILNAEDEEKVKDYQFNRVMSSYQSGLITAQDAKKAMNKDSLLAVEVDEETEALPPIGGDFLAPSTANVKKPENNDG